MSCVHPDNRLTIVDCCQLLLALSLASVYKTNRPMEMLTIDMCILYALLILYIPRLWMNGRLTGLKTCPALLLVWVGHLVIYIVYGISSDTTNSGTTSPNGSLRTTWETFTQDLFLSILSFRMLITDVIDIGTQKKWYNSIDEDANEIGLIKSRRGHAGHGSSRSGDVEGDNDDDDDYESSDIPMGIKARRGCQHFAAAIGIVMFAILMIYMGILLTLDLAFGLTVYPSLVINGQKQNYTPVILIGAIMFIGFVVLGMATWYTKSRMKRREHRLEKLMDRMTASAVLMERSMRNSPAAPVMNPTASYYSITGGGGTSSRFSDTGGPLVTRHQQQQQQQDRSSSLSLGPPGLVYTSPVNALRSSSNSTATTSEDFAIPIRSDMSISSLPPDYDMISARRMSLAIHVKDRRPGLSDNSKTIVTDDRFNGSLPPLTDISRGCGDADNDTGDESSDASFTR